MALSPARTCWTAWSPDSAPRALMYVAGVEQLPELAAPVLGERVGESERGAQTLDLFAAVGADDAVPAVGRSRRVRSGPRGCGRSWMMFLAAGVPAAVQSSNSYAGMVRNSAQSGAVARSRNSALASCIAPVLEARRADFVFDHAQLFVEQR